jgi:hypothetical protein
MNVAKENAVIKSYLLDADFKQDNNKHKYILLWSSKFYRIINKIMRKYPLDLILNDTKYTRHYIIKMIHYFFKYGIHKDKLKDDYLYRGVDKDFLLDTNYEEKGFMSTSLNRHVASGNIMMFNVQKLPKNVPFVLIDDNIDQYLAEQEVLFLPGSIKLKKTSVGIKAIYKMNPIFYELNSLVGGGRDDCFRTIDESAKINLRGKYIVWYRAIVGRPVEIVGLMEMPKKTDEACKFFNKVVLPHDDKYEMKTEFIPQYKDLKEKKNKTKEEFELFKSYSVHMAIYDAKQKKVLTIHYGVFDEMFLEELFDAKRQHEVEDSIIRRCSWL